MSSIQQLGVAERGRAKGREKEREREIVFDYFK